uniref:Uncharacterized protein n=1 Tax=Cacopsylla melanoneura TaxID=428564 RepID=A0A8D8Y6P2_9HEMI
MKLSCHTIHDIAWESPNLRHRHEPCGTRDLKRKNLTIVSFNSIHEEFSLPKILYEPRNLWLKSAAGRQKATASGAALERRKETHQPDQRRNNYQKLMKNNKTEDKRRTHTNQTTGETITRN